MARSSSIPFTYRLILSLVVVFGTYNPSGYSFFHWVKSTGANDGFASVVTSPLLILTTLALLIGWLVLLHATMRSLGVIGLVLSAAFFGVLLWLVVDWGWLSLDSINLVQYILLLIVSLILALGMAWAELWRRMTGQVSVDRVDEGEHHDDGI